MADQNQNSVTDAALEQVGSKPDVVSLPAAEVLRLRGIEAAHTGLEKDTARSLIERDLLAALGSHPVVEGTQTQLVNLWRDDFVAKRVDGRFVIEAKSGGTPAEVVKARLGSTDYSHFVKAAHRGGGVGPNQNGGSAASPSNLEFNGFQSGAKLTPVQQVAANMAAARAAGGGRGINFPTAK